jgi:hypothetical protein
MRSVHLQAVYSTLLIHHCRGRRDSNPGAGSFGAVVLPVVGGGCDPAPESGLLAGAAGRRRGVSRTVGDRLDLAGQLEGLPLVHDKDGLEPLGESGIPLDGVGVGGPLQQLDL